MTAGTRAVTEGRSRAAPGGEKRVSYLDSIVRMDRVNRLRTNGALSKTRDHCCGWKNPVNMVGDSERRLEVGTARTGLQTLAVWGSVVVCRKNPGSELQKIPKAESKKKS